MTGRSDGGHFDMLVVPARWPALLGILDGLGIAA
jgi:hypothetical protein